MSFWNELKRRNVIRMGAAYVVVAWLIIQVVETIFPVYGLSDEAVRLVVTVLAIGLFPVVILAWAFELTPEGFKKDKDVDRSQSITSQTGKNLDRAIMVVLAIALGYFAFDKFVLAPARDVALVEKATEQGRTEALEGSVRKAGNRVRITAQLIDARSDTHIWSETYDRTLDDIFAVQDEVAAEVVKHLHLALMGETPRTNHINAQAYALFLQARQIRLMSQEPDFSRAETLLKQALKIEPDYVDALILLSDVASDEALAAGAISRATALDPDNAFIKVDLAANHLYQNENLADAARLLEETAAIDPYEPTVLFYSALLAKTLGQIDLAIRLYEFIAVRDPLFFWAQLNLATVYFEAGRIEEALGQFEIALSLHTTEGAVQWKYGLAKVVTGEPEAALAIFLAEEEPIYRTHGLVLAYHDLSREEESTAALQKLLLTEVEVWPWGLAHAYAWIGDADQAFFYMNAAMENGRSMSTLATNPLFQKLRSDARWLPFLRSVEQTQEQLASIEFSVQAPK